jgi:septal ring factor EnvC (AmiA/AmiB activator)
MLNLTIDKIQMKTSLTHPRILLFLIFCFLITGLGEGIAQSRKELESRRKKLNSQIKNTSNLLSKTAASRKATLQELSTLQSQMKSREELINVIQEELSQIDNQVLRKQEGLKALEEDLSKLKSNYKKILVQLYRYKTQKTGLLYVLSTESFNKIYQRQIYLTQLEKKRSKQASLIRKTQKQFNAEIAVLEQEKQTKAELLKQEVDQKASLDKELGAKDEIVKQLKRKESQLRKELKAKAQSKDKLNRKIEDVIRGQIAAAKSSSRSYPGNSSKNSNPNYIPNKSSDTGKNFGSQKGRLPKPVSSGAIVSRFGRHQHPLFEQVTVNNNGIDFRTPSGASVKAVYSGEVVSVFAIPGSGNAVMLKHGNYYTTYSNLSTVYVKRGDKVSQGKALGKVGKEASSGSYILHFELWNGKSKVNPEPWLR